MAPDQTTTFQPFMISKEAFECLFREHYSNLCSYVFFFLKDSAASEEVVQEVFVTLWQKRDSLNITSSIKAYLYRAARNHSLNVIKHLDIRESYKIHNERLRSDAELSAEIPLETQELEKRIGDAIDKLPTERKRIFLMSRYEGLKYSEIAEQLNISVKTVEAQMGKALKFLREQLVDYLPLWLYLLIFIE